MRFKLLLFILAFVFLPVDSWAATITADSCSLAHVTAAYNAAMEGDRVVIPAGECTWTSELTVLKAITILGAGSGAGGTKITLDSGLHAGAIVISLATTSLVRVSGIYFDKVYNHTSSSYAINIMTPSASDSITQLRIDHCRFDYGKYALNISGDIQGVVDNNYFLNCNASIQKLGKSTGWDDPIVAGMDMGLNTLYIEDNEFVRDSSLTCGSQNFHIESGHGGRFIVRYNTFDGSDYCKTECTASCGGACYTDYHVMPHGNMYYYSDPSHSTMRGHPIMEVYNNTFMANRLDYSGMIFRGGSVLVHDNDTTTLTCTPNSSYYLREEEADGTPTFSIQRTEWPAEDQIFNSFFWNNTINGNPITSIHINVSTFIQEDRDYFMHAPAETGGKETFTDRPGAAGSHPTDGDPYADTGTMTFSSSGSNAYYPYTPFTYPHPLRKPSAPAPRIQ